MTLVWFKVFIIYLLGPVIYCTWFDEAHYYTIYNGDYTWNDAREICTYNHDQLLYIQTQDEWNIWIELLNSSYTIQHRSSDGIYWFGLHAPDTKSPGIYYWDDCTLPEYLDPAVDDYPITDYVCITMWVRREVFNYAFMDMWLKGRMCNETHSIICTNDVSGCSPTCDEMTIKTDVTTCNVLCDGTFCSSTYFSQLGLCHVIPVTYTNQDKFYLCHLPSADFIPTACTEELDTYTITTNDGNMNVTDTVCSDINNITTIHNDDNCTCLCSQLWTFLAQPPPEEVNLTIEEKVEMIVEELTVDRKNTTVSIRKYVSVMDDRASSVGIGIVAGTIIFSIFGIIVLFDLSIILHHLKHVLIKIFKCLRPDNYIKKPIHQLAEAIVAIPFALATGERFKSFPIGGFPQSKEPFVITAGGRFKTIQKHRHNMLTETKPSFVWTAGGRIKTLQKHQDNVMAEKKPAFVWAAGGRIKAFTTNPPSYEHTNIPTEELHGRGWLMRERQVYNDIELPAYPDILNETIILPGAPPEYTEL